MINLKKWVYQLNFHWFLSLNLSLIASMCHLDQLLIHLKNDPWHCSTPSSTFLTVTPILWSLGCTINISKLAKSFFLQLLKLNKCAVKTVGGGEGVILQLGGGKCETSKQISTAQTNPSYPEPEGARHGVVERRHQTVVVAPKDSVGRRKRDSLATTQAWKRRKSGSSFIFFRDSAPPLAMALQSLPFQAVSLQHIRVQTQDTHTHTWRESEPNQTRQANSSDVIWGARHQWERWEKSGCERLREASPAERRRPLPARRPLRRLLCETRIICHLNWNEKKKNKYTCQMSV